MTDSKRDDLRKDIDTLENTMRDADQFRTLEEQVADMKRRGIDPSQAYKDLDRKEENDDCSRSAESADMYDLTQDLEQIRQDSRPKSQPASPSQASAFTTSATSPWGLGRFSSNIRYKPRPLLFSILGKELCLGLYL